MVGLRSSPPPVTTVVGQWVLADYPELRLLRASLRQAVDTEWPGSSDDDDDDDDDVADRMAIVATELATNALRHARSPAVVRLSRAKNAFVVDVADDKPLAVPDSDPAKPPGTGGRGLEITRRLASDTGWYVTGGHKHVWARFSVPHRGRRWHAPRIAVRSLDRLVQRLRRIRG
jgi:serine/threonine-protein kinase RsbW